MYYSINLDNITPHNEFVSQTYGGGINTNGESPTINGTKNEILNDMTKTFKDFNGDHSKKFNNTLKDSDMKDDFM